MSKLEDFLVSKWKPEDFMFEDQPASTVNHGTSPGSKPQAAQGQDPARRGGLPADRAYGEGGDKAFHEAYQAGLKKGLEEGRLKGFQEAQKEGFERGLNEGRAQGREEGHAEGFEAGHKAGHLAGHSAGHEEGVLAGRNEALAGFERKFNDALSPLVKTLSELDSIKEDLKNELIIIAVSVAKKFISLISEKDFDFLSRVIVEMVEGMELANCTVLVHPDQFKNVYNFIAIKNKNISVKQDEYIRYGEVKITTIENEVCFSIDDIFEKIKNEVYQ